MAPLEKRCIGEGCSAHPLHGYQASKDQPVKWACPAHKHLLIRPASAPTDKKAPSLFKT